MTSDGPGRNDRPTTTPVAFVLQLADYPMDVHLVDGTYELFRHFFGQPPRDADDGSEIGAARGVVMSVLSMLTNGATHVGVATDHVIESFRNELWPGYKTGEGIDPALRSQFEILETALQALGVGVWPMVELEADDALASAAAVAANDPEVKQVVICTPDKDLAQCVVGDRVVQLDRRKDTVTDEAGVWANLASHPSPSPTGSRSSGIPPTASRVGRVGQAIGLGGVGALRQPQRDTGRLSAWDPAVRRELRGAAKLAERLATERELRCCSRTSPLCAPTPRCSGMWPPCAGGGPRAISRTLPSLQGSGARRRAAALAKKA